MPNFTGNGCPNSKPPPMGGLRHWASPSSNIFHIELIPNIFSMVYMVY